MSEKRPFYVTTPIYYVTDAPHIGHLYTTVAADILARFHRLNEENVWFLTGTDEHGQKIQKKAKETNETPKALADRVVTRYQEAWKVYGITHDDFIRTTEERHKKVVQEYVSRLMKTGDIYLSAYEGWYCVPCEAYWTEKELKEKNCPDCGRPVELLKEESYFFKMSAFEKRLVDHIEKNPEFIVPETRKNEVLGFIRQGLKDISVSRTTIQWGIDMPIDPKATKEHKIYVWFDALTNYVSALDPLGDHKKYDTFWKSAVHLVGKDILRFHAVYWPTFLMALGLPLPKQIVAHGWLTDSNRKISKSLGNAIDPIALSTEVGIDGMRYFLFREFVFGYDGEYTKEIMYKRINSDLANDYGNCVNRVTAMTQKYFGDGAMDTKASLLASSEVKTSTSALLQQFTKSMEVFEFHKALESIWSTLTAVNKHIENSAPWALAKSENPADKTKLLEVLLHCHEALRVTSILLLPFIPSSAAKALHYLGTDSNKITLKNAQWGAGPNPVTMLKAQPLFPRLEWKS